jgi:hypothetical protein
MGRLIIYEGSDEEIRKYLSSMPLHTQMSTVASNGGSASKATDGSSSAWDQIAADFLTRLDGAASDGHPGQKKAVLAWLRQNGEIELSSLWKASGVKNQHDYGGIGSSLTRNMKRAGGPKKWYTYQRHSTKNGDWVYTILPELAGPLKRAFAVP